MQSMSKNYLIMMIAYDSLVCDVSMSLMMTMTMTKIWMICLNAFDDFRYFCLKTYAFPFCDGLKITSLMPSLIQTSLTPILNLYTH